MPDAMLPVLAIAAQITERLACANRLVLAAPTGSGKTTQVPPILLRSGIIAADRQIIVLQPRRLATRMVARRVAQEMGVPLGGLVGYQTRHDSQISAATRIRFMTEGLLLRLLQSQPLLAGVGAVVLDEFHERNLAADLALGLLKQLQEKSRPDLRMVVMSATLDTQALSVYLDAPILETGGRLFPVEHHHLPHRSAAPAWDLAAQALQAILASGEDGDVLIFMPGAYEIRKTIEACRRKLPGLSEAAAFFPLHGSLPAPEQDAALAPNPRRKVVVSTNVAETSITIEGIRHVIDSGLARIHRYDARRGINVLRIEPISQASATQRAGRAGRTAPGTCRRLWTQADHRARPPHETPEVRRVDLAEPILQMMSLGVADVRAFPWLEPPEEVALRRGMQLLQELGALDERERLTDLGRQMAAFPVHPRLSRMLLAAARRRCLARAALWAALISDREILSGKIRAEFTDMRDEPHACDLVVLERLFHAAAGAKFQPSACAAIGVHGHACREVEQTRRLFLDLCKREGLPLAGEDRTDDLLKALLTAFPDHVAVLRDAHSRRCVMSAQKRVVLDKESIVKKPGPILALDARQIGQGLPGAGAGAGTGKGFPGAGEMQTVLNLAGEIDAAWLEEIHPGRTRTAMRTALNEQTRAVEEIEEHLFDDLVIAAVVRPRASAQAAGEILVEQILRGQLKLEQWDARADQWIARVRCVRGWFPERPMIAYDDDDLRVILHEIVAGASQFNQVKDRPVLPALRGALSYEDQRFIERMAPAEIKLPSGHAMKIEYQSGSPPRGRAKIQDFYDLSEVPRVAAGRVKVVVEILGPNYRPLQVTDDLAGFWKNLYPTLRKELSRRYPRHEWR